MTLLRSLDVMTRILEILKYYNYTLGIYLYLELHQDRLDSWAFQVLFPDPEHANEAHKLCFKDFFLIYGGWQ